MNTTDAAVTLSGKVSHPEEIGQAMLIALQTEGVQQVISTITVQSQSISSAPF